MYKLFVLCALVACAVAAPKPGYLGAAVLPAAPVVAAAPVATSYANTYKVVKSPVVAYAAAPVAYAAAPALAYSAHPAPLTYAAAPVAYSAPLAYSAHATW